jgi:hypothetical protein
MTDNSNVSVNDDATMKPESKRLRSSEPDLKILVGANDETVEYRYHSSIMANQSNYIDTMLATPMKESKAYEISFPDIAPSTWEAMMNFLEAPMARLMTIEDAMEVAPVYDKYDFQKGRELCGQVLTEYFQDKKKIVATLNCFVDAVLLADAANLNEAKKVGVEWLCQTFESFDSQTGRIIFTETHIRKLVPLITKDDRLCLIVISSVDFLAPNYIESRREDLRSPRIQCALVMEYARFESSRMLRNEFTHIMLSGTGCKADGICTIDPLLDIYKYIYYCNRRGLWAGVQVEFKVELLEHEAGWVIIGATLPEINEDGDDNYDNVVSKTLWRCPNSQNRPLPPKDGWIPVDEFAIGRQPTVSYRMNDGRSWTTDDE